MKKLLLVALIAASFTACGGGENSENATEETGTEMGTDTAGTMVAPGADTSTMMGTDTTGRMGTDTATVR